MKKFSEFMQQMVDNPDDPRKYIQRVTRFILDLNPHELEDTKDLLLKLQVVLNTRLAGGGFEG